MTISNVLDPFYSEQEMYQTVHTSLDASAFVGIMFSNNSLFMSVVMHTWLCSQFWKSALFDLSQSEMKLRLPRIEESAGLCLTKAIQVLQHYWSCEFWGNWDIYLDFCGDQR